MALGSGVCQAGGDCPLVGTWAVLMGRGWSHRGLEDMLASDRPEDRGNGWLCLFVLAFCQRGEELFRKTKGQTDEEVQAATDKKQGAPLASAEVAGFQQRLWRGVTGRLSRRQACPWGSFQGARPPARPM